MINKNSPLEKGLIIVFDIIIITCSYLLALYFRLHSGFFKPTGASFHLTLSHIMTLSGVVLFQIYIFYQNDLYSEKTFLRRIKQIPIIIRSSVITIFIVLFFSYLTKGNPFLERRSVIVIAIFLQIIFLSFFRLYVFRRFFQSLLKKGIGKENVVLIGQAVIIERLKNALYDFDKYRFTVKGMIETDKADFGHIKEKIFSCSADTVFVVEEGLSKDLIMNIIALCKNNSIDIFLLSDMFDMAISKIDVSTFEGIPVVDLSLPRTYFAHLFSKRVFDILLSSILLVVLSPLFLVVALLIKLDSKGPVIFKQDRIGKGGRPFKMFKFRTMYTDNDPTIHKEYVTRLIKEGKKDESGVFKISEDPRITNIGKFLRKHSLDELPQIENVFMGHMSLVGPRPPLQYEVENYDEWHKRRLAVHPGMTGLWQVSGRNRIGFEDMVLLDIYYVENWTIWLDIQIILKTIPVVFFKHDGK